MGATAQPRLGIVDAHHHLWTRARHQQPWIDPVTMAAIDADFEADDLAAAAGAVGVTRTVVVQTVASEAETRDLLTIAAGSELVTGVVGWVDLTAADVAARLERLCEATGGDRLVGIRHLVQDEPDPGFLDRADVRRGITAVGAAGLVFDLLVRDHQLPGAVRLARDLPDVRFVLDHLGKPALRRGELGEWMRDLGALARLPNTAAKLSGLVTEADWSTWTPASLRPVVRTALECFGPERLMFGSDWPVCLLATSYREWIATLSELLEECDAGAQAMIWHRTARRIYGLDDR
ncbi:amidohydrolase [Jiangella rhizosphaerae]|uniref:Amidohydrolase n=2 Tax=Jiangella rhizosphaerae TaxID=2293569 RepID=A0A418KM51_9ACTN|nr:amidohydrolase [Jiangella rhizosphaerae]